MEDVNSRAFGNAQDHGCKGVIDREQACGTGQLREKPLHGTFHLFPRVLSPERKAGQQMHAWLIRPERFGEPLYSFEQEVVDVPGIGEEEVLVYVMAAGVNYNNVWAATGVPQDVIAARHKAGETESFHIGGSDASGIVYKVGDKVSNVAVGDEVVLHCGTWSPDCPLVRSGADPTYSPTFRSWGYETNWGSFAQFARVQAHQCLRRPKHLSWAESLLARQAHSENRIARY